MKTVNSSISSIGSTELAVWEKEKAGLSSHTHKKEKLLLRYNSQIGKYTF